MWCGNLKTSIYPIKSLKVCYMNTPNWKIKKSKKLIKNKLFCFSFLFPNTLKRWVTEMQFECCIWNVISFKYCHVQPEFHEISKLLSLTPKAIKVCKITLFLIELLSKLSYNLLSNATALNYYSFCQKKLNKAHLVNIIFNSSQYNSQWILPKSKYWHFKI